MPAGATAKRVDHDPVGYQTVIHPYNGTSPTSYEPGQNPDDWLTCEVWAADEVHAIKIASEKRAEYFAQKK